MLDHSEDAMHSLADMNMSACRELHRLLKDDGRLVREIAEDIGLSRPVLSILSSERGVERTALARKLDVLFALGRDTVITTRASASFDGRFQELSEQPPLRRSEFGSPQIYPHVFYDGREMMRALRTQLATYMRETMNKRGQTVLQVSEGMNKHRAQVSAYRSLSRDTLGSPKALITALETIGVTVELRVRYE